MTPDGHILGNVVFKMSVVNKGLPDDLSRADTDDIKTRK